MNVDMAYMAGVIDSDGYIGVHRSTYAMRVRKDAGQAVYQARVQVKQTEPQAIELFVSTFGGHRYQQKPSALRGRPLWTWQVHSAACKPVLNSLLPYLRIKRDRAINALQVCDINSSRARRRFPVPTITKGEPMVTMAEAARRLGKSYAVVYQAIHQGSVPHVRNGPRQVLIPESYLPVWAERRRSPVRNPEITERLETCFLRAKELNHVGITPGPV